MMQQPNLPKHMQKVNKKLWDTQTFSVLKENDEYYLIQTSKRRIAPEDVMDEIGFCYTMKEQTKKTKEQIAKQPEEFKNYMENEHPKHVKESNKAYDNACSLFVEMNEKLKPLYDARFSELLSEAKGLQAKFTDGSIENEAQRTLQATEKALMELSKSADMDYHTHPIIVALRKELA